MDRSAEAAARRRPPPHRAAGLVLAALAGLAGGCGGPAPPDVLLITVDTLRADRLGAYGHARGPSPVIDRLLAQSVSFPDAIVPRGQTWPTLATIQTSWYPVRHGVRKNGQLLAGDAIALAELLHDAGWVTGAFLSNAGDAGWRGFDVMNDLRDEDRVVVDRAKGWLRGAGDRPVFTWVHLFAPHRPYAPPSPFDDLYDPGYDGPFDGSIEQLSRIAVDAIELAPADLERANALYDGEIRWVDGLVGELLDVLRETGREPRTIVVFTADHGEELYDRHRYFSHSASIYDTVLRVPLAFRWPGKLAPGRRLEGVVEAVDLAPTILSLVGRPVPDTFDGRDLAPALRGTRALDPARVAFSEIEDKVVSARTSTHRLVHNPTDWDFPLKFEDRESVYPIGVRELYDLRTDPGERVDRAADEEAVALRLQAAIEHWQAEQGWEEASRRHAESAVSEELRERLEAIGYVQ